MEMVEPSLLIQEMTCKPFEKQEIDRSTVWLTTFCWCLVIFGFSFLSFLDAQQSWACLSAVIMPSSHPTPPKKAPPFPFPIPAHKRKAEILKHPDTLQYYINNTSNISLLPYGFCYLTFNNHKEDLTHCSTETLLHTFLTVHHFGKVLQNTYRNKKINWRNL